MEFDFDMLVPISICVVLPVMIVWLVTRARQNETNKKTEIMLKAIESGATIDANFFKEKQGAKTIKESLLKRLAGGCIFTLMGIVFTIIGFVSKNMITDSYVLHYFEDRSIKEISSILQIPQGTVKYYLSTGRNHLKSILQ